MPARAKELIVRITDVAAPKIDPVNLVDGSLITWDMLKASIKIVEVTDISLEVGHIVPNIVLARPMRSITCLRATVAAHFIAWRSGLQ